MSWDDILEQDLAKRLFQHHLAAGKIPGAYLLAGPDGVGKRQLAIEMAKSLTCMNGKRRPCDSCANCARVNRLVHPDVHLLAPTGSSGQIRIDEVRSLLGRLALRPFSSSFQVAIIERCDRLTEEAANSLLKTLEEPSRSAIFLLTAVRLAQCLPTVVSRCQLIRCRGLSCSAVERILCQRAGLKATPAGPISHLCLGSASRALELAGRWEAYCRLLKRFEADTSAAWFESALPETRQGVVQLLDALLDWLRDLVVAGCGKTDYIAHTSHIDVIRHQAGTFDLEHCLEASFELMRLRESIDQFANFRPIASLVREKWLELKDNALNPEPRTEEGLFTPNV